MEWLWQWTSEPRTRERVLLILLFLLLVDAAPVVVFLWAPVVSGKFKELLAEHTLGVVLFGIIPAVGALTSVSVLMAYRIWTGTGDFAPAVTEE